MHLHCTPSVPWCSFSFGSSLGFRSPTLSHCERTVVLSGGSTSSKICSSLFCVVHIRQKNSQSLHFSPCGKKEVAQQLSFLNRYTQKWPFCFYTLMHLADTFRLHAFKKLSKLTMICAANSVPYQVNFREHDLYSTLHYTIYWQWQHLAGVLMTGVCVHGSDQL